MEVINVVGRTTANFKIISSGNDVEMFMNNLLKPVSSIFLNLSEIFSVQEKFLICGSL